MSLIVFHQRQIQLQFHLVIQIPVQAGNEFCVSSIADLQTLVSVPTSDGNSESIIDEGMFQNASETGLRKSSMLPETVKNSQTTEYSPLCQSFKTNLQEMISTRLGECHRHLPPHLTLRLRC